MIDRTIFFDHIRKAPASDALTALQVDGMGRILDEWDRLGFSDPRWLAYMLATTWHETGTRMQPVREGGSEEYLRSKPYYPWVGEGLVQVTWQANAKKFGAEKPGDCMTWPVALEALFDGMTKGMFTGHKLSDYFNAKENDPINARRIVNGVDRASMIAIYHASFLAAIEAATKVAPIAESNPAVVAGTPASIPQAAAPRTVWARLTAWLQNISTG